MPGPAPKPKPLTTRDPGLSPKTVVNVHRMVHAAWKDFATWKYVPRNVVAEANKPRIPRTRRETWNLEEIIRFLHHARDDRFFALWALELTTGMRRCELAGAQIAGFDPAEGTLDKGPTRVVVDGKVIDSDGKTENSWQTIALDPWTTRLLQQHIADIQEEKDAFADDYQDSGKLFCWPDGTLPHPDTLTTRFKKIAAKASLPEIHLHDARHSYITAGRKAKVDQKALSQRVGHSSVAFTMENYMHGDLDADRELAHTMAALILPAVLGPTAQEAETP